MAKGKSSSKEGFSLRRSQENALGLKQWIVFAALSVVIAAAPVALYLSPAFQLDLAQNAPQLVLFTLGAAVLLVQAQSQVFSKHHKHLFSNRKVVAEGGRDVMEAERELRAAISKEAMAYAIFVVNTLYLLGVLVLGYQILPKLGVDVSATVNHMVASLVPAMFVFGAGKQLL